jgi:hypothetical protein
MKGVCLPLENDDRFALAAQEMLLCTALQIRVAIYAIWTRGKGLESIRYARH